MVSQYISERNHAGKYSDFGGYKVPPLVSTSSLNCEIQIIKRILRIGGAASCTKEKTTETFLRLIVQKPIEEHIGSNDGESKSVEQHLDVREYLVGRDMPFSLEGV